MKKLLCFAVVTAVGISCLFGCSRAEKETYDVANYDNSYIENTAAVHGCYSNDDFVIELICTDENDGDCTYNLIMFSKDSGDQKFFGTAKGSLEKGLVCDDADECKTLCVKLLPDENIMIVSCSYKGVEIPSAGGEYVYLSDKWEPFDDEKNVYIREGVYRNGDNELSVYSSAGKIWFVIKDENGRTLCEGSQKTEGSVENIETDFEGVRVSLVAGLDENKLYIEVLVHSSSIEDDYSGMYRLSE